MKYENVKRGSRLTLGADRLWRCDRCAAKMSNQERAKEHSVKCDGVPLIIPQRAELQAVRKRKRRRWV